MRLHDLLRDIAFSGAMPPDNEITLITEDSRKVIPGSVFVCVEGARFDGHNYAARAIANGAACIVAQRSTGAANEIYAENTRAAYTLLCAAFFGYPARKLTLVGVTGTNGKTTIAYVLKKLFDYIGYNTGLIGTMMNMVRQEQYPAALTTPDSWEMHSLFARMAETGCTHCFMEASSQALDQRRLEGLVFDVGIFSNLTQDHLDYHGNFENYLLAKRKLFLQSVVGITNIDDEQGLKILKGTPARPVTYSMRRDDADYTAKRVELQPDGVAYELVGRGCIGSIRFGMPCEYSVYNSMAVACAAIELGLEMPQIIEGLANCGGVRGRMEVVPTNRDFTVIIDFAHTPDALDQTTRDLRRTTQGRLITLFGCGGERDVGKRPMMGRIVAERSDIVIVTSDNPRSEDERVIIAHTVAGIKNKSKVIAEPDRRQAIAIALNKAKPGDVVLLAGKGHEDYQALACGDVPFDEREIVKEILNLQ